MFRLTILPITATPMLRETMPKVVSVAVSLSVYTHGSQMLSIPDAYAAAVVVDVRVRGESLEMGLIHNSTNQWACHRKHVITNLVTPINE